MIFLFSLPLKNSWLYLEKDLNSILTEAFLEMFSDNPDIKSKFFQFRNHSIEDLKRDKNLTTESGKWPLNQ